MKELETAFFVRMPRTVEDLRRPHLISLERPYIVIKTVSLSAIEYENFITDMTVDRQFIEDYAELCREGDILLCLRVQRRNKPGSILIIPDVPDYAAYVKLAAYVT